MRNSPTSILFGALAGGMVAFTALTTQALLVDPLDDTDNFFGHFGGATTVVTAPGEVTIFRNVASVDTGVDWQHNGAGGPRLSLSTAGTESVLEITPVTPVNGGFYTVQILFFNGPTFVSENTLIPDTNSTAFQRHDIALFAQTLGITATDYNPRFRIGPFNDPNPGFTFTEITAIPEPSVIALAGAGFLLAMRMRKR
jgi:hypothetical protein